MVSERQALSRNLEELSRCFETHCRLLQADLFEDGQPHQAVDVCRDDCPHRHDYKLTLIDTITVLENTRRSFKSKQIEALRKKLTQTLAQI